MTDQEREPASLGTPAWKSPVTLSILLHVLILVVALSGWSWNNSVKEPPPRSISARLITSQPPQPEPAATPTKPDPAIEKARQQAEEKQQLEEKRKAEEQARKAREEAARQEKQRQQAEAEKEKARKAEEARQKAEEAARQKAEAEAKAQAKKKAEEERKREEAERKAAEERRKQEEAERQRKEAAAAAAKRKAEEAKRREAERKLKEQQLAALAEAAKKQREAEQRRQAEAAAAARARQAQMLSESEKFQALIRDRLSRAWYPPSSATSEMTAKLEITLLPTGELVSVRLINSSGNTAFDNSALSAVKDLRRFPVPEDQATFERYFRRFSIEFNPEQLR